MRPCGAISSEHLSSFALTTFPVRPPPIKAAISTRGPPKHKRFERHFQLQMGKYFGSKGTMVPISQSWPCKGVLEDRWWERCPHSRMGLSTARVSLPGQLKRQRVILQKKAPISKALLLLILLPTTGLSVCSESRDVNLAWTAPRSWPLFSWLQT